MCEFCCKPWWRFMCICASVEAVTGFNRLIWLVSFCSRIFLWVLCQGLLVLIGASIFFRGTWMCLLICTSEDTKTGVNWTRTIFISFQPVSPVHNCMILHVCKKNSTMSRLLFFRDIVLSHLIAAQAFLWHTRGHIYVGLSNISY